MDDSVKEYLLFRGLHVTAKTIENELKSEKDRALSVSIVKSTLQFAHSVKLWCEW